MFHVKVSNAKNNIKEHKFKQKVCMWSCVLLIYLFIFISSTTITMIILTISSGHYRSPLHSYSITNPTKISTITNHNFDNHNHSNHYRSLLHPPLITNLTIIVSHSNHHHFEMLNQLYFKKKIFNLV